MISLINVSSVRSLEADELGNLKVTIEMVVAVSLLLMYAQTLQEYELHLLV